MNEVYYVRRKPRAAKRPATDALERLRKWGFAGRLKQTDDQARWHELLKSVNRRGGKRADQFADILTQTVMSLGGGKIFHKDLVPSAVVHLLALMADRDCDAVSPQTFFQDIVPNGPHQRVIVVLGCQTDELLLSRVQRAFQVSHLLGGDIRVVLSGKHPPRDVVHDTSECETMASHWNSLDGSASRRSRSRAELIKVVLEGRSVDTKENIRQVLAHRQVFTPRGRHLVVVVSSSFHLPRVAEEMQLALLTNPRRHLIDRLVFAPAETRRSSPVLKQLEYRRAAMFELYRHVVADWIGTRPAYLGRTSIEPHRFGLL